MKLGDDQGKCTHELGEGDGRLGNDAEFGFAFDEQGRDDQGGYDLNQPAVAGCPAA